VSAGGARQANPTGLNLVLYDCQGRAAEILGKTVPAPSGRRAAGSSGRRGVAF
jgi:hypothetical protein